MENQDIKFCSIKREDADEVLELMHQCEIAEDGFTDCYLEDLLHDWEEMDISKDACKVLSNTNEIIGYTAVQPWGDSLCIAINISPKNEVKNLAKILIEKCEQRVREILEESAKSKNIIVKAYISSGNKKNMNLFEELGYSQTNYVFNMRFDLRSTIQLLDLESTVKIRTFNEDDNPQEIYSLVQEAFERPGRTPQKYDDWKSSLMRKDIFNPDLWFIATIDGELAGVCLSFAYPDEGWIRQIAVSPNHQGKGLGKALLLTTFRAYQNRELPRVGLAVESDNPKAYEFYEKAGMKQVRQYIEFSKVITI